MNLIEAPSDEAALAALVRDAAAMGEVLHGVCGGSKQAIGRPGRQGRKVDLSRLGGIVDYDPAELTMTLGPATPLAEVQTLLAGQGQRLAFDPFDHGPLLGRKTGAASIGGVMAAGVAGSRRLSAGGARDHVLGLRAVSGRGEVFVAGSRMVKNVTGYDLPKLLAGSWGRLALFTQLTIRALPKPAGSATLVLFGLDDVVAIAAMSAAMGCPAEVAAACHLPQHQGGACTALLLEGVPQSVTARAALLGARLAGHGTLTRLEPEPAAALWQGMQDLSVLPSGEVLWRLCLPPGRAAACVQTVVAGLGAGVQARWVYDWAGGLVWLALACLPREDAAGQAAGLRAAVSAAGGHAMLVQADEDMRRVVAALHPQPPAVAAIEARVKAAFDPACILDPDRFGAA